MIWLHFTSIWRSGLQSPTPFFFDQPFLHCFLFPQVYGINQSKDFQEKKRRSLCLLEAQSATWNMPCLLLYRICLFSTLLCCFFVEAFKPERHIGEQPCPTRFHYARIGVNWELLISGPSRMLTPKRAYCTTTAVGRSASWGDTRDDGEVEGAGLRQAWTWLWALQCQWHVRLPLWVCLCTANAGDYPSQGGGSEKMSIKLVAHSREQFLWCWSLWPRPVISIWVGVVETKIGL